MNWQVNDKKELLCETLTLLDIDGIGVSRFFQLVDAFGSPSEVLSRSIHDLTEVAGIGRETASAIVSYDRHDKINEKIERINRLGWAYFFYNDSDYPDILRNIPDRPPLLFYMGEYRPDDFDAIAIVGSRVASENGRHFATRIASQLADNGITIVSGMARGIDTCAHRGALKSGGRTIAVFGSSLDIIYPSENREIAEQIIRNGCIFSEYLPGTEPFKANFTNRNRIISGLSHGTIIVEAAERSGALSTAAHTLRQNREVFAVPGAPGKNTSMGTNQLIKQGARLLTSMEDIFDELPRLKGDIKVKRAVKIDELTKAEKEIINLFTDGPVQIDLISRTLNQPVTDIMPVLLALELKGIIKELSGKRFILD